SLFCYCRFKTSQRSTGVSHVSKGQVYNHGVYFKPSCGLGWNNIWSGTFGWGCEVHSTSPSSLDRLGNHYNVSCSF
ncbi:unnamed protein product, partial [Allacma fusca]